MDDLISIFTQSLKIEDSNETTYSKKELRIIKKRLFKCLVSSMEYLRSMGLAYHKIVLTPIRNGRFSQSAEIKIESEEEKLAWQAKMVLKIKEKYQLSDEVYEDFVNQLNIDLPSLDEIKSLSK